MFHHLDILVPPCYSPFSLFELQVICKNTQQAEVAFLLDASSSVGTENWDIILNFVTDIVKSFKIKPNKVNFIQIIYNKALMTFIKENPG